MQNSEIIKYRLINQQIAGTNFQQPGEIVKWMVAMQAQEYAMAKWAIGLRLPGSTEAGIDEAFNKGAILRTHLMRPTWHFVCPEDIRWLTALTAPRIQAGNAFSYRKTELDSKTLNRCNDILIRELEGGKHLTRATLQFALNKKKIQSDGLRLAYIMMNAELNSIICSGPRTGKQFTYALLEERAPKTKKLNKEESLIQFAKRYYTSRGPATIQDFAYWSGLTIKDARMGAEALPSSFEKEKINGLEYYFQPLNNIALTTKQSCFLMPVYDEYGMSYKNRSVLSNPLLKTTDLTPFNNYIVTDGTITGAWKRSIEGKNFILETTPLISLSKKQQQALLNAEKRYWSFINHNTKNQK